jgi:aspartyl-tRNA synthetase
MIQSHRIKDVKREMEGEDVSLCGHVSKIRDIGGVKFLILRDSTGEIQVTAKEGRDEESFYKMEDLQREDCISVKGTVIEEEKASGGREVIPSSIEVLSESSSPLPLDTQGDVGLGLDTQMDWRPLDLRREEVQSVFRVQESLIDGMLEELKEREFRRIFTPSIIGTAAEGGSEVFPVHYYDREAFLRQDPQLHRELAIGGDFERVFELGPSWRAEKSNTSRHLCEHRGLSVERAYIEDERDIMSLQEEMIISGLKKVESECQEQLETLGVEVEVPDGSFPVLEFPEIYDILEEKGIQYEYGKEPSKEGEEALYEYVKEEYGSQFFFINKFPFEDKGIFYIMKSEDSQWARSVDLVYGGLEISTGGQREHRYSKIMEQVEELGMEKEGVEWYTKYLQYGVPPHGGFTIGIERLTMELLQLSNIREGALFPRAPDRLEP